MIYRDILDEDELQRAVSAMNVRAKQVGVPGRMTAPGLRDRILASGGRCEWCGRSLVEEAFEVDHIVSLGQHGHNTPENVAVACMRCNRHKASKSPVTFALELAAETHHVTPLARRLLDEAGMKPRTQRGLFDDVGSEDIDDSPHDQHGESSDDVPPYRW